MAIIRRKKSKGALQDLLLKACPAVDGVQSVPVLAAQLKCTTQTIYYWLAADKIPSNRAQEIVQLGGGLLVKIEDFYPFIFRNPS